MVLFITHDKEVVLMCLSSIFQDSGIPGYFRLLQQISAECVLGYLGFSLVSHSEVFMKAE